MLVIPGGVSRDLCDGLTRRELLRVGGSAIMGLSLAEMMQLQELNAANKTTATATTSGPAGWGKAKSVILVFLQGGPSHLDLWDPKNDVPDNVRSVFKPIDTVLPGIQVTELMPKFAKVLDRTTLIRSMSYTPNGLFNHTAAIYQMLTGYTADKVSPSGQLEPPSPKDYPNIGSQITRLKPTTEPMLPFVMMPRPLQESNVVGKAGTAGFLGRAVRSVHAVPQRRRHGHEKDGQHQGRRLAVATRVDQRTSRTPRSSARRDQQRHARD